MELFPPSQPQARRHLISVADLDRDDVERILATAESFEAVMHRDLKKVPTLRGRTVMTVFFESSTRTSSSFELAAKRLSADVVSLKAAGSSVDKGESLRDTIQTLSAYDPDVIVIRHAVGRRRRPRHPVDRRPRGQRRRRLPPAPHPVPARPVHDPRRAGHARLAARRHRRRRHPLAGGALEHPGPAHARRPRHAGGPADPDPTAHDEPGSRGQPRHLHDRRRRRDLCAADAARAHGRGRRPTCPPCASTRPSGA